MRIDLHMHSTASDGVLPPAEVVERARAGGLDIIALADHDTVAGVAPARAAAGAAGGGGAPRIVPAIEVSATHLGREVHILGYGIDTRDPVIESYDTRARAVRANRIREMIDRLAELDVEVRFDAVVAEAGPESATLARPHLARVLWSEGHVSSVAEAFDRFIGDDGPAFVPVRLLDTAEAIRTIHRAGGIAVWAHPPSSMIDPALGQLAAAGLDGLECYRPRVPPHELDRLLTHAEHHDLLVTGGSDWHGDWHGPLGGFHVDRRQVGPLLDRLGI